MTIAYICTEIFSKQFDLITFMVISKQEHIWHPWEIISTTWIDNYIILVFEDLRISRWILIVHGFSLPIWFLRFRDSYFP